MIATRSLAFRIFTVLAGWAALIALGAAAGPAAANTERIVDFHSRIEIHKNSEMTVTETIRVFAMGLKIQRGIYREFPTTYRNTLGHRVRVGFTVVRVLRDGKPEPWFIRDRSNGKRVYLGRNRYFLPRNREYTYTITYRTTRQIGFFEKTDELYWNVTGNGWAFPIDRASATVVLPPGAPILRHTAFTGAFGAKGTDWTANKDADGKLTIATTRPLPLRHGLTIVVGWPKGIVAAPTFGQSFAYFLTDNLSGIVLLAGLFVLLAYYGVVWLILGRDPPKGVVIPRFKPPKGFSPAATRYVLAMGFDKTAFTAAILNLAVKGYLVVGKSEVGDYSLEVADRKASNLSPGERRITETLFKPRKEIIVTDDNHEAFGYAIEEFKKTLKAEYEAAHFVHNRAYLFVGIGLTLAVAIGFLATGGANWSTFLIIVLGVVLMVINVIFGYLLRAPTRQGRRIMDEIEGFKLYLGVAEKDRLDKLHPPDKTPALFERFLPYAVALGVGTEWGRQFRRVLKKAATERGETATIWNPLWYHDASGDSLNPVAFSRNIGTSLSSAISSASTAPGSDSGSGFDGGGFSGGGGGGGGGGGW